MPRSQSPSTRPARSSYRRNRSPRTPPYLRLAADLRAAIKCGALQPGDPLPTVAALATRYGVAFGTAQRAMAELAEGHEVEVSRGRRARVGRSTNGNTARDHTDYSVAGKKPAGGRLPLPRTLSDRAREYDHGHSDLASESRSRQTANSWLATWQQGNE